MSSCPACWTSDSHNRRTTIRGPGHWQAALVEYRIPFCGAHARELSEWEDKPVRRRLHSQRYRDVWGVEPSVDQSDTGFRYRFRFVSQSYAAQFEILNSHNLDHAPEQDAAAYQPMEPRDHPAPITGSTPRQGASDADRPQPGRGPPVAVQAASSPRGPQSATSRHPLEGHTGWVNACAVSPDGTFIVSAGLDQTIRIWEVETGSERRVLTGHTKGVTTCAISPDGTFIVSGSADKTLRIWDVDTGSERRVLTGHTKRVTTCAISPDGTFIVSGSEDKTLRIW